MNKYREILEDSARNVFSMDEGYYRNIKYYCSKCKYYKGECTLKRIIRICKKKGLRNVPISED